MNTKLPIGVYPTTETISARQKALLNKSHFPSWMMVVIPLVFIISAGWFWRMHRRRHVHSQVRD